MKQEVSDEQTASSYSWYCHKICEILQIIEIFSYQKVITHNS